LDVLIAVGGEDTLSVAAKLANMGLRVVGVPKTVDNDIVETDVTFGFDTAVNVTVDAIDRIQTTGESHDRIMIVEVMGRHAGWIAAHAGVASGANLVLVPEHPFDLEEISAFLRKRHESGATAAVVVVGESCSLKGSPPGDATKLDEFGHVRLGGIGDLLAKEIERRTGIETRAVVLGHVVRGGAPSASDRVLTTRLWVAAVEAVKNGDFGVSSDLLSEHFASLFVWSASSRAVLSVSSIGIQLPWLKRVSHADWILSVLSNAIEEHSVVLDGNIVRDGIRRADDISAAWRKSLYVFFDV
jgi:6-phosphofructokinase